MYHDVNCFESILINSLNQKQDILFLGIHYSCSNQLTHIRTCMSTEILSLVFILLCFAEFVLFNVFYVAHIQVLFKNYPVFRNFMRLACEQAHL